MKSRYQTIRRSMAAITLINVMALAPALAAAATGALSADQIKERLQQNFVGVRFERVIASPTWPGFYEVATETELIYTNADASRLFVGNVIDVNTKDNLTAKRWRELNKIDTSALPLQDAIKKVKGDGSRKMYVFSDPDCPYCKKLEKTLEGVDNVTIYTFLYPIEELHPNARTKSDRIWCSSDRVDAWDKWMLQGVQADATCDHSVVDRNLKLGSGFKINGTPAIFFANGQRIDGAVPVESLEKELAGR